MKKMEIGVLAMLRKGENPFPAFQKKLGLTTAQLQNWDMTNLTPETAKKVKKDIAESRIRLAAFWGGYTGTRIEKTSAKNRIQGGKDE